MSTTTRFQRPNLSIEDVEKIFSEPHGSPIYLLDEVRRSGVSIGDFVMWYHVRFQKWVTDYIDSQIRIYWHRRKRHDIFSREEVIKSKLHCLWEWGSFCDELRRDGRVLGYIFMHIEAEVLRMDFLK